MFQRQQAQQIRPFGLAKEGEIMSVEEENLAIGRRFYEEVFNQGQRSLFARQRRRANAMKLPVPSPRSKFKK